MQEQMCRAMLQNGSQIADRFLTLIPRHKLRGALHCECKSPCQLKVGVTMNMIGSYSSIDSFLCLGGLRSVELPLLVK